MLSSLWKGNISSRILSVTWDAQKKQQRKQSFDLLAFWMIFSFIKKEMNAETRIVPPVSNVYCKEASIKSSAISINQFPIPFMIPYPKTETEVFTKDGFRSSVCFGFLRKSKIQKQITAAKTLFKNINDALDTLDFCSA